MRALFVNDLGFQFGAGIAHLRQIQSFLLCGWEVAGLCWQAGPFNPLQIAPFGSLGKWYGLRECSLANSSYGFSDRDIGCWLLNEAKRFLPNVIVFGNIHGAKWSLDVLVMLRDAGYPVIAYMHDCYYITGRCAYPESCNKYQTGCDAECPTKREYPFEPVEKIAFAWQRRQEIFASKTGIPLATNSEWTRSIVRSSLSSAGCATTIHYGIDEKLFSPFNKKLARRFLGIPEGRPVILYGAINVKDERKGGDIFRKIVRKLRTKAFILAFGANSESIPEVKSFGLQNDWRVMPLLYNAADIFVGTARQEAFGQTFCEAAACGIPSVAFAVGGIPEIARDQQNAILVDTLDPDLLYSAVINLLKDANMCKQFGETGRKIVEAEFSLRHQADRWTQYLEKLGYLPTKTD